MIEIKDKYKCTGCTACYSICPHGAISMDYDKLGHSYPVVNRDLCVDCSLCELVCPFLNTEKMPTDADSESTTIKAVYNKNETIRSKSTSGGIFSIFAKYVLYQNGVVYAARFDENFKIIHSAFDNILDIDAYRGSKYAQSDLGDTFKKIKKDLKKRKVLFVGTPCQVAGLKSYLRRENKNLLTCDFICMGISSPIVWKEYLNTYWKAKGLRKIVFKDKRDGWHQWKMLIEDQEGEHLRLGMNDPFFYGYLTHLTFRPSCFKCPYRQIKHLSDFTIADCWGIDKVNPLFDDNKGCTTLILQNEKAYNIFQYLKTEMAVTDFTPKSVMKYNPYSVKEIEEHPYRQEYESYCYEYGLSIALDKIFKKCQRPFWFRVLKYIYNRFLK